MASDILNIRNVAEKCKIRANVPRVSLFHQQIVKKYDGMWKLFEIDGGKRF